MVWFDTVPEMFSVYTNPFFFCFGLLLFQDDFMDIDRYLGDTWGLHI